MKNLIDWLLSPPPTGPGAIVLLRLMAGGVFLWEGVLKFVYTNQGVGRFTKIGIPVPHVMATFIGGPGNLRGILFVAGLFSPLVSLPLVVGVVGAAVAAAIVPLPGA